MRQASTIITAGLAGLLLLAVPSPFGPAGPQAARAQEPPEAPASPGSGTQDAPADGASPAPAGDAPFMAPLGQLASILGSMSFLRTLCGEPEAGIWRDKMQALIDAQKPDDADERRLIASFNSGYRGFESTYRKCTPAARTAIDRYRDEGLELAREIVTRYGN